MNVGIRILYSFAIIEDYISATVMILVVLKPSI